MKLMRLCILWVVIIVTLAGCNNTTDEEKVVVNIQGKEINQNKNILMQKTDESDLGFKPEYKIEIAPSSSFTAHFQLLGERLDYLKPINSEANFDMTIDVDSTREKKFRLMIWDGESFTSIRDSEQVKKFYDINIPDGKNYLVLNNELNLMNNSQMSELAFLVHDRDFPADIDYQYSPIRMYITPKDDLSDISIDKDNKYKIEKSFIQNKTVSNDSGVPELSFLDEDKNVLNVKHLTSETEYLSINQTDYDINESIVFYDINGNIYESYFMMHPSDQQVVIPIPSEIKKNIGETDYFVLINNNFGQSGVKEIQKIGEDETIPYLNYSFSYKLGNKSE